MSHKSEHAPDHAAKAAKPSALTVGIIALILVTLVVAVVMQQNNAQAGKRIQSQIYPGGMESTKVDMSWLEDEKAAASAVNTTADSEKDNAEESVTENVKTEPVASDTKSMGVVTHRVTIKTVKGDIEAELYGKDAPKTVDNFVKLIGKKFYDGLTFHRVEPGFVIQGGDPKGNGTGGSEETIKLEIAPKLKHVEGALAMARTDDPDSATSQFYITLDETPQTEYLDGKYAVFGKVTKGMNIAQSIAVGDKMTKVTVEKVK